jgi:hypothetical protein
MKKIILSASIALFLTVGLHAQTSVTVPTLSEPITMLSVRSYGAVTTYTIEDGNNISLKVEFNFVKGDDKDLGPKVLVNTLNQFYKQDYEIVSTSSNSHTSSGSTLGYSTQYLFHRKK